MNELNNAEINNRNKKVQKNNGPFCFLLWIFKVEIIILTIVLVIKYIPDKTKFIIKYNIEKNFSYANSNQEITKIEEAIQNNKSLSSEEKEIISNDLKTEILENIEYINIDKCAKRIRSLKIIYPTEYNSSKKIEDILEPAGSYSKFLNKISIHEKDDEIYMHEFNHLISENRISSFFDIDLLSEIVNEHFAREYTSDSNLEGYNEYMFYSYAIAKLLPEEKIREYKFTENQSILVLSLLEIDDDIDKAYEFFEAINLFDSSKKFHDIYNYYYKKKYGIEIKDDIEMLLYFYNSPAQTKAERQIVREYLKLNEDDEIIEVLPKGFFSEKYKTNHQKNIIKYIKNKNVETVEI